MYCEIFEVVKGINLQGNARVTGRNRAGKKNNPWLNIIKGFDIKCTGAALHPQSFKTVNIRFFFPGF